MRTEDPLQKLCAENLRKNQESPWSAQNDPSCFCKEAANPDLFILAAEPSADLLGSNLIKELLQLRPSLKIAAVSGPLMRSLPIETHFFMESLQVMGFTDVLFSLPHLIRQFFAMKQRIYALNPKAIVCIDYPGFNLRLEKALRKKGYAGKLIHYVCPTVWAWGRKRIPCMAKTIDLLLTLFPFEKECFSSTSLHVEYVGHPLSFQIPSSELAEPIARKKSRILAIFPGSRETEIVKNFPLQLGSAKRLSKIDPTLEIAVSIANPKFEPLLRSLAAGTNIHFYPVDEKTKLMQNCNIAIATSGTVTLELALHAVPTVVNFAIRPLDLFIAKKILHIDLPFYCIVNIILSKKVFPELFGPNLTENTLFFWVHKLWSDPEASQEAKIGCRLLRQTMQAKNPSLEAARQILYHL